MKKHILLVALSVAMIANVSICADVETLGFFSRMSGAVSSVLNKETVTNFVSNHKLALGGLAVVGVVAVCVAKLPLIKKCLGMTEEKTVAITSRIFSASTSNSNQKNK